MINAKELKIRSNYSKKQKQKYIWKLTRIELALLQSAQSGEEQLWYTVYEDEIAFILSELLHLGYEVEYHKSVNAIKISW